MQLKSVSDSTQCNRALKLRGQHWPQSKRTGTPQASTHHLPPVSHLLVHESLSISCSLRWAVSWSEHLTPLTGVSITSWPGTSCPKCTFTLWILVNLHNKVLVAGGLQEGASKRRKQKLLPSRQSQFQPDTYKVKHLQGFHLWKCFMLKIGISLLELLTLLHKPISPHIFNECN